MDFYHKVRLQSVEPEREGSSQEENFEAAELFKQETSYINDETSVS